MRLLATTLLVPALLFAGAGTAAAADDPVACGDALTTNTRLTESLYCEDGPGLRIDTPGVTLDLGGHSIVGNAGIGVSVTADGVTVSDGDVVGFPVGVYTGTPDDEYEYAGGFDLPETPPRDDDSPQPSVVLDDLEIARNGDLGLEVAGFHTTLTGSTLVGNDTGARAEYGGELLLDTTEVTGNGLGLQALEGGPIWVEKSLLRRNGTAAGCSESAVFVADSVVSDNGTGVDYFICGGSSVVRSFFSGNDQHLASEGFPDQLPTVGCTVFVFGGPAPDFPGAPCF